MMGNGLARAFAAVAGLRGQFTRGNVAAALGGMMDRLAGAGYDDGAAGALLDGLANEVENLAVMEQAFPELAAGDLLEIWRRAIGEIRTTQGREDAVLDALGWLELPYQGGGHLVLVGMHDGMVPDSRREDALLPDSIRAPLGLRDRAARAARDAFLFKGMLESRVADGGVTVVAAKFDGKGEPRKPSSLLLRCPAVELPGRVAHCFDEIGAGSRVRPASARGGWQIGITKDAEAARRVTAKISPTLIRDYLACPFRFYLRHVLRMERYEPDQRELDPRSFGTLLHRVLQDFGGDESARGMTDATAIGDYLTDGLDGLVGRLYGGELSLPLMVQVASARERLVAFAYHQAAACEDGWEIRHVEYPVGHRDGPAWQLAGHEVSMTIDRIDFHPGRRAWRVLDYKTGAVKGPADEHLETARDGTLILGDCITHGRAKKPQRWKNVQLPMYAAFCREVGLGQFPGARPDDEIQIGYITLPRAVSAVEFSLWDGYDAVAEASAMAWSAEAVRRIDSGVFGPPTRVHRHETPV